MQYLAGIDAGTTGATVMIVDTNGTIISSAYREYPCIYPRPGWVEQDLELVWAKVSEACREAIAKSGINPKEVGTIGI